MSYSNCRNILINVISLFLLATLLILPVSAGADQRDAVDAIKRMNSALLESMKKGEEIGFKGRYDILSPVIRDVFALTFMGQASMGSYWKTLSPEQKKQYLDVYTDWTVSSYAGNFDSYSGEKFEIKKEEAGRGDKVSVVSALLIPNDDPVEFDYTLRRFQESWRIVDINIEGVSQLALTRGQFVSILKKKGFDGLMESLKDKIATIKNKQVEGN
jgi:phospholipid transport system substrate-binding protein